MASDYDLVIANFKMKVKVECCPKSIRIRIQLDKLKEPEIESGIPESCSLQIGGKLAALNLIDRDIDIIANDIKVGLLQLKRY